MSGVIRLGYCWAGGGPGGVPAPSARAARSSSHVVRRSGSGASGRSSACGTWPGRRGECSTWSTILMTSPSGATPSAMIFDRPASSRSSSSLPVVSVGRRPWKISSSRVICSGDKRQVRLELVGLPPLEPLGARRGGRPPAREPGYPDDRPRRIDMAVLHLRFAWELRPALGAECLPGRPGRPGRRNAASLESSAPTRLSGVEAPAVRPTASGPLGGSQPARDLDLRPPTGPVPDFVRRHQARRRRRCGRSARRSAQICARLRGVAAVVPADHDHQVERRVVEQRDAPRPAGPAWRCRSCRTPGSARPAASAP